MLHTSRGNRKVIYRSQSVFAASRVAVIASGFPSTHYAYCKTLVASREGWMDVLRSKDVSRKCWFDPCIVPLSWFLERGVAGHIGGPWS